jgi:hypothetical protein
VRTRDALYIPRVCVALMVRRRGCVAGWLACDTDFVSDDDGMRYRSASHSTMRSSSVSHQGVVRMEPESSYNFQKFKNLNN